MQLVYRKEDETAELRFVVGRQAYLDSTIVFTYNKNTIGTPEIGVIDSFYLDCCGYVIIASINTELITDGSYYCYITIDGGSSVIEEIVLKTEALDSVSNYEGVKITG